MLASFHSGAESENVSSGDDHKGSRSERSSKERMCILVLVLLCLSVVSSLAVVYSARQMLNALLPPLATTDLADEPILRLENAPLAGYGSDVHVKLESLPTFPNVPAQEKPHFEYFLGPSSRQTPSPDAARARIVHSRHRHDGDRGPRPRKQDVAFEDLPSLQHGDRKHVRALPLPRDNNLAKMTVSSPEHRSQEATATLRALGSTSTQDAVTAGEAEMSSVTPQNVPATGSSRDNEARHQPA